MSSPVKSFKRRTWFRFCISAVLILGFGAARMQFESRMMEQYRTAFFHGETLNIRVMQDIGQESFLAALGGFRAAVADILWLEAYDDWTRTEWGKMLLLFNNATALQPRNLMFWEDASWHMAYNASVAALNDPKVPRMALRLKHQHEYFLIGKDLLERGIENNPDKYKLHEDLANLYAYKLQDHCDAATEYAKAASYADALTYNKRFAAYELSYCPGHEREAYELLLKYYREGEKEWLPTLLSRLHSLEETLNIPASERVNIPRNLLPPPRPTPPPQPTPTDEK